MLHRLDAGEIKRLMLERGYSAYKLAKAVGIDAKTLRRWLDGEAAKPRTWRDLQKSWVPCPVH